MPNVELSTSREFDTIICEECGYEFLLFGVIRLSYKYEPKTQLWNSAVTEYCPRCGAEQEYLKEKRKEW